LEVGKVTVSIANNYLTDGKSVFDADALLNNIEKAFEIAERAMMIDFSDVEIKTSVAENAGAKFITDITVGGLIFDNSIFGENPEEPNPIYDVEWTEFPIELQQKISEGLILVMINEWLTEAGENTVEIDTPDEELTSGQKRAIILGIVRDYADETIPEEMSDEEINKALWTFGFRFNAKGKIEDETEE
jgi:hypothetical protein